MAATVIRGTQVLDGTIQRADIDVSTVGQSVTRKLVQGAGITLSSTGADSGTGDVTVAATISSGTWTNLTPASGWTVPTQAQYRVEVNGAVSTVYFRGMI